MGDLINRETATELLRKRLFETALNNVGYVTDASEIYEDVANKRIDVWMNEVPSEEAPPDDDCVSRKDFLKRIEPYNTDDKMDKALYNFAYDKIMCTKIARPEPTPGVWIVKHTDIHIFTYCSRCGADGELTWHYCPMCGTQMKPGQMLKFADNDTAQGGLLPAT